MIHRHLEHPADVPILKRGLAALDDMLDRGDLADWRPVARGIAADPWGPVARDVLHLCAAHPMYGTSWLWPAFVASCRARPPTASLGAIRAGTGLSQAELGRRMGMNQSEVSKLERRADVRLSTLRAAIAALGGRMRIIISHPVAGKRELVSETNDWEAT